MRLTRVASRSQGWSAALSVNGGTPARERAWCSKDGPTSVGTTSTLLLHSLARGPVRGGQSPVKLQGRNRRTARQQGHPISGEGIQIDYLTRYTAWVESLGARKSIIISTSTIGSTPRRSWVVLQCEKPLRRIVSCEAGPTKRRARLRSPRASTVGFVVDRATSVEACLARPPPFGPRKAATPGRCGCCATIWLPSRRCWPGSI